jgi:hypothetical protein
VLQYWYFCAFNDWRSTYFGVNDHEADWATIAVYLVRDDAADDGTLPHPRPPQVDIENGIRSTVPFLSRRPSTVIAACTSFARSEESRWSTWPHRQAFGCSAGGSS